MLKDIFNKISSKNQDLILSKDEQKKITESSDAQKSEKKVVFKTFRERLKRTRENFFRQMDSIFLGEREIDSDVLEELEELLVMSDIGVATVDEIFSKIKEKVKRRELSDVGALMSAIKEELLGLLEQSQNPPKWEDTDKKPYIILFVGVNGVGKTTSIAKLGSYFKNQGKRVMFVAGDTFRAAAIEQLETWAKRLEIPLIKHSSGADPSAVVFDAVESASKKDIDILIIDTAGRLHTKINLMEELKKIKRTIGKKIEDAPHDIFIVIDATTGQNGLQQVFSFRDAVGVTGILLTKLDSTAKGGIVISIIHQTHLPVRFIGLGEGVDDFQPFEPEMFVDAILGREGE